MNQYTAALQRANSVRSERAEIKRALVAGRCSPIELLRDPPVSCRRVPAHQFLTWLPHWGDRRADRTLLAAQVSGRLTLEQLTERARGALAEQLSRRDAR